MSSIVTGDRYVESLVEFVDRNAGQLLDGTLTLKLNPVGLHYVHSRLDALQELEGLLAGAPVDYLRAYVSDLGDHRALEQLRRILGLLTSLKVISVLPPPARDPTPLSLLPFGRLKVLELRRCDLSTSAARGLLELQHSLEKLICHNSTDALRHVFASRIVDIKDSPAWNRLSFVSCACNGLVLMDESLQLLPAVETLDLSRNQFAKVANLRKCTKLQHLDLGFNHLRSISSLCEVSCRMVKLILRNNALTTLDGIENLKTLEGLDLSYNIISSFTEMEIPASLPCLQSLWLEGNPLCCARWYRSHAFSFFSHPEKLILDENGISTREYWERHIILASRQKLPSGYGFYFPAKYEAEDEGCLDTKRKKYSRLASIEDEEQRRYSCSEPADQESVSCASDNHASDKNAISDGEAEIVSLMNKIEYMKKEQSVLWLREFKEWMDQSPDYAVERNQCTRFSLDPSRIKYIKQSDIERLPGENSGQIPVLTQAYDGDDTSNFLEPTGAHGNGFDPNDKVSMEHAMTNDDGVAETTLRTGGPSPEKDLLNGNSCKRENLSRLEVKAFPTSSLGDTGGGQVEKISAAPMTAIDEIMGSHPSSTFPRSPPYYQEDILQRRLYLEEEFLQLSAESQSFASSDSDTSCSEDDTCKSSVSIAEVDHLLVQNSIEDNITDKSTEVPQKNNNHEESHEEKCLRNNKKSSFENYYVYDSSLENSLLPNHDQHFSRHGCSDDSRSCFIDGDLSQYNHGMEKQKGKQKHKRRIVSLSGNSMLCDTGPDHKGDEILEAREDDAGDRGQLSCNGSYINDQDQFIKDFFHLTLADSGASETCQEVVRCGCTYQLESVIQESEIALLRSCKNKLYILLIDVIPDGQEIISEVLGFHRLEELREVVVGLGLQSLRVHMEGGATYMFLPRTGEKSKDILFLLGVGDSTALSTGCSLRSWEQVQVNLLEKYICGSIKMGIVFYSMVLFWHDDEEDYDITGTLDEAVTREDFEDCSVLSTSEGLWVSRSLFVVEGCLLVCVENLECFSCLADDSGCPYYSLDSCCQIPNILEMVIEMNNDRCLILTLNNVSSGNISTANKIEKGMQTEDTDAQVLTWKLKWFSEETLLKFVALLKAIHLGLVSSPLPVKCIS